MVVKAPLCHLQQCPCRRLESIRSQGCKQLLPSSLCGDLKCTLRTTNPKASLCAHIPEFDLVDSRTCVLTGVHPLGNLACFSK